MTVKEYLKQAYRLNELIQCNQQELEELKLMSTSIGAIDYSKDRIQTSPEGDASYTRIVMKIIELENAIKKDIEDLLTLKIEIRQSINAVQDHDERLVLHKRYLDFETWEQICSDFGLSMRTVQRIHATALNNVTIKQ